jgi:hypothetical protein
MNKCARIKHAGNNCAGEKKCREHQCKIDFCCGSTDLGNNFLLKKEFALSKFTANNETSHKRPAIIGQEQVTRNKWPGTSDEEQVVRNKWPWKSDQEQVTRNKWPGSSDQEQVVRTSDQEQATKNNSEQVTRVIFPWQWELGLNMWIQTCTQETDQLGSGNTNFRGEVSKEKVCRTPVYRLPVLVEYPEEFWSKYSWDR